MTVEYSYYVATSKGFPSAFVKLLKRWRGSIYKLIYCDLLVFLGAYYALNMSYRFLMNPEQQEQFADVVSYFSAYNKKIPVTFVLGFYVSIVVGRWSNQIFKTPWPDPVAVFVSSLVRGNDERGRKMRRTVMRYINLSHIMVFTLISPRVKKRFPTYDHLVDAGVLVENEKRIIVAMDGIYPKLPKYWMPIVWASSIFTRARLEGRIRDDFALRTLNDSINSFRHNCITLLHYDTISIPLVYTQVVTLAVYSYFIAAIMGNQWIQEDKNFDYTYSVNYYFPLFSTLEFFFFVGWLKVAETLICPFGEDDDDFEINSTIDRNVQVSYIMVDEMHNRHPLLIKDQYWDEVYPPGGGSSPPEHSTAHLEQKPVSPRVSVAPTSQADSIGGLLWKRLRDNTSEMLDSHHRLSDTDRSQSEMLVNKHVHSFPSEELLEEIIQGENEEEEEGMTFERLREDRERERIERQQQKLQRTVENVADMTQDLPMRMHRRLTTTGQFEISPQDTDEDETKKSSENDQRKKEDEQRKKED